MPVTVLAIIASVWALARSYQADTTTEQARKYYSSPNPTLVSIENEGEYGMNDIVKPVEHRTVSIPMATSAGD